MAQIMNPYGNIQTEIEGSKETTRPFRYDRNQTPYDSTVEVTNRFKGLDLIDKVPEELWTEFMTLYRRQGARPSPRKRNAKSKMSV